MTSFLSDAAIVPYPDASFDCVISEYGACLWADPPEDGVAATARLLRPAFGMDGIKWPGDIGVEFHLSHGDWIGVLKCNRANTRFAPTSSAQQCTNVMWSDLAKDLRSLRAEILSICQQYGVTSWDSMN